MKSLTVGLAAVALMATPLTAGDWFNHKFGELRSYHKDWLNVCNDKGAGTCRAVQYQLPDTGETFFGESRLALIYRGDGVYDIEVFDRGLDPISDGDVVFDFGSDRVVLTPNQWRSGGADVANVAETFVVNDQDAARLLTDLVMRKSRLVVKFVVEDAPISEAQFSLRGSLAALNAIEMLKSP
ncbi:MAG: hypothetical protein JXQ85_10195 [Cognatishimia sp.]|uniref:hypothetical protein n=1 Tax=Cognatishimia sp. TaxID=2211648 RepID=UPI003B8DD2CD